jgi:dolichyl-phosphate beta-glucosyltransferase
MPALSVIIPLYDEERRLEGGLAGLAALAKLLPEPPENIVVDDGSRDGTLECARRTAPAGTVVLGIPHAGKGAALAAGVAAAHGERLLLTDVDWSVPPEEIPRLLAEDADVVLATREGAGARRVGEPLWRHLMGRAFNRVVRAAVLPGIQDSQCGCKVLRADLAQELFAMLRTPGWAWDVEILAVARARGARIQEVPVTWRYEADTRLKPLRDAPIMVRDVLRIRRELRAREPR